MTAAQRPEDAHDGYLIADAAEAVLHNRWGVTEPGLLAVLEREATVLAAIDMADLPVSRGFDRKHLADIHRRLFGDVYEWAGMMRDESAVLGDGTRIEPVERLEKAGTVFAAAGDIDGRLESLAETADRAAMQEDVEAFAMEAAAVLAELNAIHPFREGNGRVQRFFLEELAREAGHEMDFGVIDAPRNVAASEAAVHGFTEGLVGLVRDAVVPGRRDLLRKAGILLGEGRQWVTEAELSRRTLEADERVDGMLMEVRDGVAILVTDSNELVVAPETALANTAAPGDQVRLAGRLASGEETGLEIG